MRRLITLAAAGTSALLLVAGCTASQKSGAGSANGAPAAGTAGGASAAARAGTAQKGANDTTGANRAPTAPLLNRALVKTADLTVRVADVNEEATRAIRIATTTNGGVDADQRSGSGNSATAQLTLEVPPDSLEQVLDRLAALGKPTARRTSTQDVTEQVADVTARLASMRASLARVRTLYARAGSISDVIKIENELAAREAGLESLEAQQLTLSRQTANAVVHLQLLARQAVAPAPRKHTRGALGGFALGWHAFVRSARWTLTAFGTVLPFLALIGAMALGALWLRRRHAPAAKSRPVEIS